MAVITGLIRGFLLSTTDSRVSAVLRDLDREWIFGFFYVPSDWNHTRRREIDTTSDRSIFTCGAYVHVRTYELTYVQRGLVTRSLLRYARTTPKSWSRFNCLVLLQLRSERSVIASWNPNFWGKMQMSREYSSARKW